MLTTDVINTNACEDFVPAKYETHTCLCLQIQSGPLGGRQGRRATAGGPPEVRRAVSEGPPGGPRGSPGFSGVGSPVGSLGGFSAPTFLGTNVPRGGSPGGSF